MPFPYFTLLAPMEGVTDAGFRHLIAKHGGIDLLCTEFVRISRAPISRDALQREVIKTPGVPLSVQVMGNDGDKMAEAASFVEEAGADVIDINLGCPMPRVVRKGVGAAMLQDRSLLARVLGEMRKSIRGTFSAKMRAGFDASHDTQDIIDIAKVIEGSGVDFLTVHCRKRSDFYEGVADWRIISILKQELSIPIVGNGDIWYARDALRMRDETGCDAVMIGRPALRNPWIFSQIASLLKGEEPCAPSGQDVLAWLQALNDGVAKERLGRLKENAKWLTRGLPAEHALRRSCLRAANVEEFFELCAELKEVSSEDLDLSWHGKLGYERSGSGV